MQQERGKEQVMKKRHFWLCLVLIVGLAMALILGGCSNNNDPLPNEGNTGSHSLAAGYSFKTCKITMWRYGDREQEVVITDQADVTNIINAVNLDEWQ